MSLLTLLPLLLSCLSLLSLPVMLLLPVMALLSPLSPLVLPPLSGIGLHIFPVSPEPNSRQSQLSRDGDRYSS